MATRKSKSRKQSDDYVAKRNKNNDAVRRSREKARQKHLATQKRVTALKAENEYLEERLQLLAKELKFLKDLFLAHTGKPMKDFKGPQLSFN